MEIYYRVLLVMIYGIYVRYYLIRE
jgi:hypothetical protein